MYSGFSWATPLESIFFGAEDEAEDASASEAGLLAADIGRVVLGIMGGEKVGNGVYAS